MLDFLRGDGDGPNLLAGTVKLGLAILALGYLVAQSSSPERLDYKALSRLAAKAARKPPEPTMTGSVKDRRGRPGSVPASTRTSPEATRRP